MSIQEIYINFKQAVNREDIRLGAIILLVGSISFLCGRLSVTHDGMTALTMQAPNEGGVVGEVRKEPERAYLGSETTADTKTEARTPSDEPARTAESALPPEGGYVASKSGAKYHLPWCSGAQRIKEENKIWFKTKAEAEAAGYTPAANCKGI